MKYSIKTLGQLTSFISKGIAPRYARFDDNNVIRVLNQRCNRNNEISLANSRLNNLSKRKVPSEKILKDNDVLINSTGVGTAGRVAQIRKVNKSLTVDGHMIIMRPIKDIDPVFYGYAIIANQYKIEQLAEGSTGQTEINRQRLLNEITLKVPSVEEQKRLADDLLNIDYKIKVNKQINANLTKLRNLQYRQLINSNTVRKVKITELFNIFYGKILPKSKLINSGIQVFGANGLMGYTSEPSIIEKPTVTITSRGSGSGYVSYLDVGKAFLTNNLLYLDDKNNLGLSFAFEAIKAANPNQFVTGSAQPQLTIKNLSGLDIAAPVDRDAIDEFRKEMHPIESMMRNNNSENYQLEHLKDTLLCKYF